MDLLDRIRNTTAASLDATRSDFDDLPRGHFSAAKDNGMVRIVEGADDLVHPNAGRSAARPGLVKIPTDDELRDAATNFAHDGEYCDNPKCCPEIAGVSTDPRSEGQIRFINSLIDDLTSLNAELGAQARTYTDGMTEHGRWTRNDGKIKGTISTWIDRLKAKIETLRAAGVRPVATAAASNDDTKFQDIPNGYYAINDSGAPDDIHYFRVSRFRDGGIKVQEQASDELHPVRRGGRRTAILTTIQTVGPAVASALYGQTIGRCGRCNRTLTDALSRSRGIGPDCWGKM